MIPNLNLYNLPWMQNLKGLGNKSKWSEISPFRTAEGAGQYGSGLNASAGQLYDHFNRKVALDRQGGDPGASVSDYGLRPADRPQSIEDFLNRRNPKPIEPLPPKLPGNIPGNIPGLPPNFQLPPNIFNVGQGMFPGIDLSQIQKQLQSGGMAGPSPTPTPNATGGPGAVPRPQPGPGNVAPQVPPNMMQFLNQDPQQPPQQQMTNPQVPQFQPSLFNMQPQMMVNRPRPGGF